jgi:PEP-CTERM motif
LRKLLLVLGLLLGGVYAYATPIPVDFLAWSGGNWQNGYPYYLTFGATAVTAVMCDDYAHSGAPGETWLANITNLGTKDLSLLRFNLLPDALTLYDEAGWLLLQTQVTNQSDWKDINYAAWHLFDSQSPVDQGIQFWLDAAATEAGKGFPGVDFFRVDILTPVDQYNPDPNSIQEFMYLVPHDPGTVPEPGTLLLLGTGAVTVFWRRRTR